MKIVPEQYALTILWRKSLSYRNQYIYLLCKPMDWFLYDRDLRHEKVKALIGIRFVRTETHDFRATKNVSPFNIIFQLYSGIRLYVGTFFAVTVQAKIRHSSFFVLALDTIWNNWCYLLSYRQIILELWID